jgi:hypothetical protein
MTLANLSRPLRFYALAGVQNVRIEGGAVVGEWNSLPTKIWGSGRAELAAAFANWPSAPESIVMFTRKYGPISGFRKPGAKFCYTLAGWRRRQEEFRWIWQNAGKAEHVMPPDHAALVCENGRLVIVPYHLHTFLFMELATIPSQRLRICESRACVQGYFITSHLSRRFCSVLCTASRQRELKRECWAKHGKKYRANIAKRKAERKQRRCSARTTANRGALKR